MVTRRSLHDAAVISGVGMTPITSNSGTTTTDLAVRAALAALDDSGLALSDVDGVVTYQVRDSVSALEIAAALGLGPVRWYNDLEMGGPGGTAAVGEAAMAIHAGLADNLLVVRAMNGRSGMRMGRYGAGHHPDDWRQWTVPYGHVGPPQYFALWAQRHMAVYGTTQAQLGAVAVTMRAHAQLNEHAYFYGKPMTIDDYFASRMVTTPFRLLDCCLENDAAAAVLVSAADRAADLRHRPVFVGSYTSSAGPSPQHPFIDWPDHATMFTAFAADEAFGQAGIGREDVDVALIYDAFTIALITQLEDLGFVGKGEGGAFVQDGHIALGGQLPVNPNGGLLSEGYVHGLNNLIEAVRQLRGEAHGRQVPGAETAIVTGGEGARGSIAILHS
jgi:acetyl-CoA acetyltransferase